VESIMMLDLDRALAISRNIWWSIFGDSLAIPGHCADEVCFGGGTGG
jgi:hypothetical protein